MRHTGAVNVGGLQVPVATTPFEQAVAAATTSWLGTGGASYRVGGDAGPVDTVFLGVFDRAAVEAVGLFDERLVRNQDYELNIRLRKAGGTVWFDPELSVGYRPRGSWRALAKQYFDYGRWKAVVMRMHPDSTRLRQLAPPAAVVGLAVSTVFGLVRYRSALAVPATYATIVVLASRRSPHRGLQSMVTGVIHATWGAGVIVGALHRPTQPDRATSATVR